MLSRALGPTRLSHNIGTNTGILRLTVPLRLAEFESELKVQKGIISACFYIYFGLLTRSTHQATIQILLFLRQDNLLFDAAVTYSCGRLQHAVDLE